MFTISTQSITNLTVSTVRLKTQNIFVQLSATHNATRAQVTVEYVNKSISATVDVTGMPVAVRDLTSLVTGSQLTIGGVTTSSRGYV